MKKTLQILAIALSLTTASFQGKAQTTYGYDENGGFFGMKQDAGSSVVLFPNPVLTQTYVAFPTPTENTVKVDVLDLSGRSLCQSTYSPGISQLELDMSMLPAGLYTARIMEKGKPIQYIKVFKDQL